MIDLWKIPMLSHSGIKARLLINSCASMFDDNMKVMKFSALAYENQLVGVIDHLNNALKEEKAKVYLTQRNLRDEVLQQMNKKWARLERREDVLQELYSTKIPLEEDELDEKLQFKPVDKLDYFQRTCGEGAKPKPNNCESRKQVSRNRGTDYDFNENLISKATRTTKPTTSCKNVASAEDVESKENTLKMDCEISNDETKNVVQNLAKGKSPGPDGIRGEFRKEINKGAITLIYKKCDDADLDN
ncbi:unnamed protein product [Clavelina lepadiformis]|uniref:Reverse transcriptase n=1 Tax=Clavelina lepadiformis TaxID=159417 RepID=A0ABP0G932_CLALP